MCHGKAEGFKDSQPQTLACRKPHPTASRPCQPTQLDSRRTTSSPENASCAKSASTCFPRSRRPCSCSGPLTCAGGHKARASRSRNCRNIHAARLEAKSHNVLSRLLFPYASDSISSPLHLPQGGLKKRQPSRHSSVYGKCRSGMQAAAACAGKSLLKRVTSPIPASQ